MEIYRLRYFLAAAETENLQTAARRVHASPAALSKAISALEDELGAKLFDRLGRRLRLTDAGRSAQARASQVMDLLSTMGSELAPQQSPLRIRIAGPEYLLAEYGVAFALAIGKKYPRAEIGFREARSAEAFALLAQGGIDFAVTTATPPAGVLSSTAGRFRSVVCCGGDHPLRRLSTARGLKALDVARFPFVAPSSDPGSAFGSAALDGWQPESFTRSVRWQALSAQVIGELVRSGEALAYVPEFWAKAQGFTVLKVKGMERGAPREVFISTSAVPGDSWRRAALDFP